MDPVLIDQLRVYMSVTIFIVGLVTFVIGAIILIAGAFGKERANILAQTNRLAQKGLAEEVSGLVGNASTLLGAMNEMITTRNGIGIVMMIIGGILMITGFYLTQIILKVVG